jgi:hypothetical protein
MKLMSDAASWGDAILLGHFVNVLMKIIGDQMTAACIGIPISTRWKIKTII